jgi:hypothetical protein
MIIYIIKVEIYFIVPKKKREILSTPFLFSRESIK